MSEDDLALDRWRGWRLAAMAGGMLVVLLGMFAPQDAAFWRMPERLRAQVATALLASGHSGLEIAMDGQQARVSGIVEGEAEIAAARRVALTSAGPGGAWAGGVTHVDVAGLSLGLLEQPFAWSARREETSLVLAGAVPSARAGVELTNAASRAFPNLEVIDQTHIAGGAPSPDFVRVARLSIEFLGGLERGEARIADTQIAFIGDGDQAGVDALKRAFADPPAPFRARFDVTVEGLDPAHPELQGLDLARGDAQDCAHAFERLMERNAINFATGSAAIEPSSRGILDSLASVALRCDRFSIEVAGHTDGAGAREANMRLSSARADAVANYLAGQGVARARLASRGYGPDRPRAPNSSDEGRAANRRIEFDVNG